MSIVLTLLSCAEDFGFDIRLQLVPVLLVQDLIQVLVLAVKVYLYRRCRLPVKLKYSSQEAKRKLGML
jgi:hypothetical protein